MKNHLQIISTILFIFVLYSCFQNKVQSQEIEYEYLNTENFIKTGQASRFEQNRKIYKISDGTVYSKAGKIEYNKENEPFNLLDELYFVFFVNFGNELHEFDFENNVRVMESNADGIAFLLHSDVCSTNYNTCIGGTGHGLGYAPLDNNCITGTPFTKSIAIEFDTYFNHFATYPYAGDQLTQNGQELMSHISFVKNGCPYGGSQSFENLLQHTNIGLNNLETITRHTQTGGIENGQFHSIRVHWIPDPVNHSNSLLEVIVDDGPEFEGWKCYKRIDLITEVFNGDWGNRYADNNKVRMSITGASGALSSYQLVHFGNYLGVQNDITLCYGDRTMLSCAKSIKYKFPVGIDYKWQWYPISSIDNPNAQFPFVRPDVKTEYSVELISPDGLMITDKIMVDVIGKPDKLFVKTFGGSINQIPTVETINGILRTPDCGFLSCCQSERLGPEGNDHIINKCLLIKTDCNGDINTQNSWAKTYIRKENPAVNGEHLTMCSAEMCNLFQRTKQYIFDATNEDDKSYYNLENKGYAVTGEIDLDRGILAVQPYVMWINNIGTVIDALSFKYVESPTLTGNYIHQTFDGSLVLVASARNYVDDFILVSKITPNFDDNKLEIHSFITDDIANTNGQPAKYYRLENKILYAYEIRNTYDNKLNIIGSVLGDNNKIYFMQLNDVLDDVKGALPVHKAFFVSVQNEPSVDGASIIEDNEKTGNYYLAGYNSSGVFIILAEKNGDSFNFYGRKITSSSLNNYQVGQIIDQSKGILTVSFEANNIVTNNKDIYFAYINKDNTNADIEVYTIPLETEEDVFNLINYGFGGAASGLESSDNLMIVTANNKMYPCSNEVSFDINTIVPALEDVTLDVESGFATLLERPEILEEIAEIVPTENCYTTPCFCDEDNITPKVTLLESYEDTDPQCCYKVEFLSQKDGCMVDEVVFTFEDNDGNKLYEETKLLDFGGIERIIKGEDAPDFCFSETTGGEVSKLKIQYMYLGEILSCENTFSLGCKCNCEDYKLEEVFEIELIPVETETSDCCYNIYLTNNNPCGFTSENLTLRYHDDIHLNNDQTDNISFNLADGWSSGSEYQDGDYWKIPISSPTNKRIVSNGKAIYIGTICQTLPHAIFDPENPTEINETISLTIDGCDEEFQFNLRCEKNCCDNFNDNFEITVDEQDDPCCYKVTFYYGDEDIAELCKLDYVELTYPSGNKEEYTNPDWDSKLPNLDKYFVICIPDAEKEKNVDFILKMRLVNKAGLIICEKELDLDLENCASSCCEENDFISQVTCETDENGNYIINFDPKTPIHDPPGNYDCLPSGIMITDNNGLYSSHISYKMIKGKTDSYPPYWTFPITVSVPPDFVKPFQICLTNYYLDLLCCFSFNLDCPPAGTGGIVKPLNVDENNKKDEDLNITKVYCSPNPLNNGTILYFNSDKEFNIEIELFNNIGEHIKAIYNGTCKIGQNNLNINTESLGSGNYLVCLKNKSKIYSVQLIVVK